MSSTPPKMTWNAAADQNLLNAIIAVHGISVDFTAVAQRLNCTPRAVQERLKKLRKMVGEKAGESEAAEVAPVNSKDNGGKTVQQAGEGGASEKSPIKGKGKGGKAVDKDGKSEITGFIGRGKDKSKKSAKEVIIYEDVEEEGPLGDAKHGTKRKRTDDEDNEVADDEGVDFEDNDVENHFGVHSLEGQLDGGVEI
ncbi:hypothetical protein MMC29_004702 [Sticta canariensis]|nr:hypothetical protein [Sticta canariensis]